MLALITESGHGDSKTANPRVSSQGCFARSCRSTHPHSLLDPATLLKRGYQAGNRSRFTNAGRLSATPMVHERIADLLKELDVPAPESASPIQFYKLKNTKAADLLSTISESAW